MPVIVLPSITRPAGVKFPSICKLPVLSSTAISAGTLVLVPEPPAVGLDLNIISPPAALPVLVPATSVKSPPAAFVPEFASTVKLNGAALSVVMLALVVLPSPITRASIDPPISEYER